MLDITRSGFSRAADESHETELEKEHYKSHPSTCISTKVPMVFCMKSWKTLLWPTLVLLASLWCYRSRRLRYRPRSSRRPQSTQRKAKRSPARADPARCFPCVDAIGRTSRGQHVFKGVYIASLSGDDVYLDPKSWPPAFINRAHTGYYFTSSCR